MHQKKKNVIKWKSCYVKIVTLRGSYHIMFANKICNENNYKSKKLLPIKF
jgi:hypothetical protein